MPMPTLADMKALPWIAVIVLAVIAAVMFRFQPVSYKNALDGDNIGTLDRWTGRIEIQDGVFADPNPKPREPGWWMDEKYHPKKAGTIPKDAASKPPLWTKLRLKSFEKIPFRMKFMGAPSIRPGEPFRPDTQFSVNTLDYTIQTQFLRVGDKIAGTDLQITQAESKSSVNAVGTNVDASELMVKDTATGDVIVLVAGREVDSPYSFALLVDTIRGEEIRVEKGKTFTFGPEGSSYKLIDVDSVAAVLEQVGSEGSSLKVPPLTTSAETPATDASIENTSNP